MILELIPGRFYISKIKLYCEDDEFIKTLNRDTVFLVLKSNEIKQKKFIKLHQNVTILSKDLIVNLEILPDELDFIMEIKS